MAKQKTRKSVSKRFKITKTGKVLHRSAFARHLRRKKSASQLRRQNKLSQMIGPRARRIKRMLALA